MKRATVRKVKEINVATIANNKVKSEGLTMRTKINNTMEKIVTGAKKFETKISDTCVRVSKMFTKESIKATYLKFVETKANKIEELKDKCKETYTHYRNDKIEAFALCLVLFGIGMFAYSILGAAAMLTSPESINMMASAYTAATIKLGLVPDVGFLPTVIGYMAELKSYFI
jgi:hypothetical protein